MEPFIDTNIIDTNIIDTDLFDKDYDDEEVINARLEEDDDTDEDLGNLLGYYP